MLAQILINGSNADNLRKLNGMVALTPAGSAPRSCEAPAIFIVVDRPPCSIIPQGFASPRHVISLVRAPVIREIIVIRVESRTLLGEGSAMPTREGPRALEEYLFGRQCEMEVRKPAKRARRRSAVVGLDWEDDSLLRRSFQRLQGYSRLS